MRFVCKISLSLLETRENTFGFLFSSRNWRKYLKFLHFFCKSSRSLLEPENRSRHFSFLFSKLEMWIPYFSFSSRFDFLASRQCLIEKSLKQHSRAILSSNSLHGGNCWGQFIQSSPRPLISALPVFTWVGKLGEKGWKSSVHKVSNCPKAHSPLCLWPLIICCEAWGQDMRLMWTGGWRWTRWQWQGGT